MDYTLNTVDDALDKNCSTVRNNFYLSMVSLMSIDIYIGYPNTSDSLSLNQPLPFRPFSITFEISPLRTTGDTYYYKFVCSFLPNTNSKVIKRQFRNI